MDDLSELFKQALRDVAEAGADPKRCDGCGRMLVGSDEREQGRCSSCEVASWSPEKKAAIQRLVGLGFRRAFTDKPVSDEDIDSAIDEAFRHTSSKQNRP